MTTVRLAVDAMGGDRGPQVTMGAVADAIAKYPDLHVICVGDLAELRKHAAAAADHLRCSLVHAEQEVSMEDSPLSALRRKRNSSSMGMALKMLQDGEADACISAGNTGALTAMACYFLKTIPGIERPALCHTFPGLDGPTIMLDLGANTEATENQLLQFAAMGTSMAMTIYGDEAPSVALLNIGTESHKGPAHLRLCDGMLRASEMNYVGYAEANEVLSGRHRVVVCDGYSGNIALKSCEGVVQCIYSEIKSLARAGLMPRLCLLLALPLISLLRKKYDHREYNGASLLGLTGVVVKSHGNADRKAFLRAMEHGASEVREGMLQRISALLSDVGGNGEEP